MSLFANAKEKLVTESIDGLRRALGATSIATLDGYPHIKAGGSLPAALQAGLGA